MTEINRKDVEVEEFDDIEVEWKKKESIISDFNRRGKTTNSKRFHKEITENPKAWFEYHKIRRESMKDWNEIPYEYIASKIKNKNRIVADFGCGENLMKDLIPNNKVYSFDHIAIDKDVIACDMAHTPLKNDTIDIAVFSLALWGTNYEDYFKEAYRLLTYDGLMYIAEPSKAYSQNDRDELVEMLKRNGFTLVGNIEDRRKFFYVTVMKK
jgi:SAM-dependent methyltransferase